MAQSQQLLQRLIQKPGYEKFMNANPEAVLYAIFAILSSNEKEGDKIQFDFFIPKLKKIAYSEYPFDEIKVQREEVGFEAKPLDLSKVNLDIEDLWQVVEAIQLDKKDNSNVNKIIGILKSDSWDISCMTTTLDIIKMKIDSSTKQCLSYTKDNLGNFVQIKKIDKK